MNRQTKRMAQRGEQRDARQTAEARRQLVKGRQEKRKRARPGEFFKEVRLELKKVNWPSRKELFAYTVVVLVAVVVLTSLVFGLDVVFAKGVLQVFTDGGAGAPG